MYRFLFRFFVMTVAILTANLLTTFLGDYLISFKNSYKPLIFTLAGMGIIVLVFYPLFVKLEDWVKELSGRVLRKGKSAGGKYLGLFLTFLACMVILTYFYMKMWYGIDLFKLLLNL